MLTKSEVLRAGNFGVRARSSGMIYQLLGIEKLVVSAIEWKLYV